MDATVVLSASVYVIVSMRPTAFRSPSAVRRRSTVAAGAPIVIEATGVFCEAFASVLARRMPMSASPTAVSTAGSPSMPSGSGHDAV